MCRPETVLENRSCRGKKKTLNRLFPCREKVPIKTWTQTLNSDLPSGGRVWRAGGGGGDYQNLLFARGVLAVMSFKLKTMQKKMVPGKKNKPLFRGLGSEGARSSVICFLNFM